MNLITLEKNCNRQENKLSVGPINPIVFSLYLFRQFVKTATTFLDRQSGVTPSRITK